MTNKTIQAAPPADLAPPADPVSVRVLLDHVGYKVNDIAELTPKEAAAALAEGWGDPDPAAVAYAASLA